MIENFESCPAGIKNGLEVEHLKEDLVRTRENFDSKLDQMMIRIEEKIDTMNEKIQTEFNQLNEHIDKIDKKVESLDKKLKGVDNLESFIEEKISDSTKNKVFNFAKWVVVVLLGTTAVTVLGKFAVNALF